MVSDARDVVEALLARIEQAERDHREGAASSLKGRVRADRCAVFFAKRFQRLKETVVGLIIGQRLGHRTET